MNVTLPYVIHKTDLHDKVFSICRILVRKEKVDKINKFERQ